MVWNGMESSVALTAALIIVPPMATAPNLVQPGFQDGLSLDAGQVQHDDYFQGRRRLPTAAATIVTLSHAAHHFLHYQAKAYR